MVRRVAFAVCLVLVTAGCTTPGGRATPGPSTATTGIPTTAGPTATADTSTATTAARTDELTEVTETAVAPRLATPPTVAECSGVGLPSPNATDGLALSAYPAGPETVTAETVADYVSAFERAYQRNAVIAEAGADPDANLTEVTVYAEAERVTPARDGYAVSLSVLASTNYASGIHGDRTPTVGYFVNETVLVREELDSVNETASAETGSVLLRCE